jgi:hypothetical protein
LTNTPVAMSSAITLPLAATIRIPISLTLAGNFHLAAAALFFQPDLSKTSTVDGPTAGRQLWPQQPDGMCGDLGSGTRFDGFIAVNFD